MSASREMIASKAQEIGAEILRNDSHVIIVKIAAGRDMSVFFTRNGSIREAAYDTDRGVRRAIRPARIGDVLALLYREVHYAVHSPKETPVTEQPEHFETIEIDCADIRKGDRFRKIDGVYRNTVERVAILDGGEYVNVWIEGQGPHAQPWLVFTGTDKLTVSRPISKLDPDGMLTPKRLREIGENALTFIPVTARTFEFDAVQSQRRIDWTASEILGKYVRPAFPNPNGPVRYAPELIASGRQYNPHVTGNAEAAQVLAREAIRLALNARLAEIEAKAQRPVLPVLTGPGMPDPELIELPDWQAVAETDPELPETREVGPFCIDEIGSGDRRSYTLNKWDNEEGAFVHVVSLSPEEADALHTALGRTLLG